MQKRGIINKQLAESTISDKEYPTSTHWPSKGENKNKALVPKSTRTNEKKCVTNFIPNVYVSTMLNQEHQREFQGYFILLFWGVKRRKGREIFHQSWNSKHSRMTKNYLNCQVICNYCNYLLSRTSGDIHQTNTRKIKPSKIIEPWSINNSSFFIFFFWWVIRMISK